MIVIIIILITVVIIQSIQNIPYIFPVFATASHYESNFSYRETRKLHDVM